MLLRLPPTTSLIRTNVGGTIVYDMGNVPNKQRGTQDADAPYSFTTEKAITGERLSNTKVGGKPTVPSHFILCHE